MLWAGTGDGLIQVTTNGGAKWITSPPQIKPWTRIFNMDAGHSDTKTAYAAANTLRFDDMNPHLWRTHDGGKTGPKSITALPLERSPIRFARTRARKGALRGHGYADLVFHR